MFHLFDDDDDDDEFTQMLGMILYKIPMNNNMDETMPAFGCLAIVIFAIVGVLLLVGFIPAG